MRGHPHTPDRCRGVSLIELVVALLLASGLGLFTVLSVLPVTQGMLLARRNAAAAQKAQVAMTRMVRELQAITNVVSGTGQTLTYDMVDDAGAVHRRTLAWSAGGALTLNGIPLSDDVAQFALRYYTAPGGSAQSTWSPSSPLAEIVLQSAVTGGIVYTNKVYMRYLQTGSP